MDGNLSVTYPWLRAIWSIGRYHFSERVADQLMVLAVLVADIWHTHGEYGPSRFRRKLNSVRIDASAVRPFAVPELLWPPIQMCLKMIPE